MNREYALSPTSKKCFLNKSNTFRLMGFPSPKKDNKIIRINSLFSKKEKKPASKKNNPQLAKANNKILNFITNCVEKIKVDEKHDDHPQITSHLADIMEKQRIIKKNKNNIQIEKINDNNKNDGYNREYSRKSYKSKKNKIMSSNYQINIKNNQNKFSSDNDLILVSTTNKENVNYQKKGTKKMMRTVTSKIVKEKEKEIVYNISSSLISLCKTKLNFTNIIKNNTISDKNNGDKTKTKEKVQFKNSSNKKIKNTIISNHSKKNNKKLSEDEHIISNYKNDNQNLKRPSNLKIKKFKTFIKLNNKKKKNSSKSFLFDSLNKSIIENSPNGINYSNKTNIIFEKEEKKKKKRNTFNVLDWANDLKNKETLTQGEYAHIRQSLVQSLIGYEKTQLADDLKKIEANETTELIKHLPTIKHVKNNSISRFDETLININVSELNLKNKIKFDKEKFRLLQHTGYVYDSLDDEEFEDAIDIYYYYIGPDSIYIYIFDSIIAVFSFYCLYYFPYYLAHDSFLISTYFNIKIFIFHLIDVFFIIDFILSFFRAFYNYDEILIKNILDMNWHYIKNWFFVDALAAIPFFSIFFFQEYNNINTKFYKDNLIKFHYYTHFGVKLDKLHYLLFINKLLKIFKCFSNDNRALVQFKNLLSKNNIFEEKSRIFFVIFILLVSMHLGSCLFIFIGRNSYPSWINEIKIENKSFSTIYICSLYFLITTITTVGYGDIYGTTIQEIIFQIILLIIGTCTYSYLISSVSNFIKKINEKSLIFENKLKILNNIKLTNPHLHDNLYEKLLRFLKYKKNTEKNKQTIIINSLQDSLRNLLLIEMYKPIIDNFIIFKGLENSNCIVQLVTAFKPICVIKNDILIQEGDLIEEVILIKTGIISLEIGIDFNNPKESIIQYLKRIDNKANNNKGSIAMEMNSKYDNTLNNISCNSTFFHNIKSSIIKKEKDDKNIHFLKVLDIRKNEHFGETLMFLNERSFLTAKVKSKKAELFFLKKEEVIKVFSNFPNIWNRINKRSIYNMKQIKKVVKKVLLNFCSMSGINIYNDTDNNNKSISILRNTTKIKKGKKKDIEKENNEKEKESNKELSFLDKIEKLSKKIKKSNADLIIEKIIEEKKNSDIKIGKVSNKNYLNNTSIDKNLSQNDIFSNFLLNSNNSIEKNNINTTKNNYRNELNSISITKKNINFSCFKQNNISYSDKTENKNLEELNNNDNDNNTDSSKETVKKSINKKPCSLIDSESINEENMVLNLKFDVCDEIYKNENFNLNRDFKDDLLNNNNIMESYLNNEIKLEDLSRKILEKTWIKNLDKEKYDYLGKLISKTSIDKNSLLNDKFIKKKIDKNFKSFSSSNFFINLKQSIVESFILSSSYENINNITSNAYIKNNKLREKTKNFLLKESTFFITANKINENSISIDSNIFKSTLFENKLINKNKIKNLDFLDMNKSDFLPKTKKENNNNHSIKNRRTLPNNKPTRTVSNNKVNSFSKNTDKKRFAFPQKKFSRNSTKNLLSFSKRYQQGISAYNKDKLNKTAGLNDDDKDMSFYDKFNTNNNDLYDNSKLFKKRKKQEDSELEEISHIIKQDAQNLNEPSLFYQNFFINQIKKRRELNYNRQNPNLKTILPKRKRKISSLNLNLSIKRTSTDLKKNINKRRFSLKKNNK